MRLSSFAPAVPADGQIYVNVEMCTKRRASYGIIFPCTWRADREAEGARLLSEYRVQTLSGVRIPSSPPDLIVAPRDSCGVFF